MSLSRPSVEDREFLLDLARHAIASGLESRGFSSPNADARRSGLGTAGSDYGVFVTLKRAGALRGCIGRILPSGSLESMVAEMARAAAFEDPRFYPLQPSELGDTDIEISLLGSLEPISGPEEIAIGVHGLYIRAPRGSGLLLPQVAVEEGWSSLEFLGQVCRKAGLPSNAWKSPEASLYRFEGLVLS